AIQHQRAALSANSKNPKLGRQVLRSYLALADVCSQLEDHVSAAQCVQELKNLTAPSSAQLSGAAAVLGRCATLAEKDGKVSQAQRKQLARSYSDEAMHLLEQAVREGYRDIEHLKKADDFKALRSRQDFQQLIAKMEVPKQSASK